MKRFVYLAGPVLGMSEAEANDWRRVFARSLEDHGITGISPLRCEPIHGPVYSPGYPDERFGTPRAIMHKNFFDVQSADVVLAYIPDPGPGREFSWGTMCELSWGKAFGKMTILVSDSAKVRNHPVLNAEAGWVFDNLADAHDVIVGVLGGYTGGKNV